MKDTCKLFVLLMLQISFWGCKGYSKYPIDKQPVVRTHTGMLGIWKAAEDTNRYDYVLVQNSDDFFIRFKEKFQKRNQGLNNPKEIFTKMQKEHEKNRNYCYYMTRMEGDGLNPHYNEWKSFLSTIGKELFLNIEYHYVPVINGEFVSDREENGFLIVRIININMLCDTVTVAVVSDPSLKRLGSSKEIRDKIAKNIDNPSFYSDTLHFYKVSNYHSSISGSITEANPKKEKTR